VTLALFLVDQLPAGDVLVLAGEEGRHAAAVKRVVPGELLLVGDGRGTQLSCRVRSVAKAQVTVDVLESRFEPLPSLRVIVVQALPKGERAELAVELLTELGVDEIVPWAAARSVAQWTGERGGKALERWRRTAREAAKQSRRAWIPAIEPLASTVDVEGLLSAADTGLVLHEDATIGLGALDPATDTAAEGRLVLVVGPEGGISPEERLRFEAAGATTVRLGPTVLRTSTAGAAALAALNLRLGRWT
jgi:16S rRNA (uracil1498-N3)-methyltransferase